MTFRHKFLALIISLITILICFGIEIIVLYLRRDTYTLIQAIILALMYIVNYLWLIFMKEPDKKKKHKKEDD